MKKYVTIALFAAILMTTALSVSATAKEMRWPEKGDAYLTFNLPDGWITQFDYKDNAVTIRPVRETRQDAQGFTFAYEGFKHMAVSRKNFDSVVANILGGINAVSGVHADPFSTRKAVTVSGLRWDRFKTDATAHGITLHTRLLVCLDDTHLFGISVLDIQPGMSDLQREVIQGIKLNGIKACTMNEAK